VDQADSCAGSTISQQILSAIHITDDNKALNERNEFRSDRQHGHQSMLWFTTFPWGLG